MDSLQILFVIDPVERLDPPTDTSLALMREGRHRGHRIVCCRMEDLFLHYDRPMARVRDVEFDPGRELYDAGPEQPLELSELDLLFMRKDPPVDLAYLQALSVLDFLPAHVVQVNPSSALRLYGEKMIPLLFADLMPETVVSCQPQLIGELFARHQRIVVKPLEECSGREVVMVSRDDPARGELLARATRDGKRFVQGQEFLPEISAGDVRVLLLGGEPLGWVRRLPAEGDFRSNINAGGRCVRCELTEKELSVCRRLKGWLQEQQIHLAGADIVAGRLLEVNITSPSCLREIDELEGMALEKAVLDYVEGRAGSRLVSRVK